jgi:hypothetical protein
MHACAHTVCASSQASCRKVGQQAVATASHAWPALLWPHARLAFSLAVICSKCLGTAACVCSNNARTELLASVRVVSAQNPGFDFGTLGRQIVDSPAKAAPRNAAGVCTQLALLARNDIYRLRIASAP